MSAVGLMIAAGCSGRRPSILLERHARGPISEAPTVATGVVRKLEPVMQTLTKGEVEVVVNHASAEFLTNFFDNKKIFGPYAGLNPYYPEHLVFYVKIANRSDKRIRIDPREFVLVDDLGSQYSLVGTDYVTAFAEYRAPVATTTRGLLSEASPGYFGVSFPVGRMFAAKPQNRFALLQQSALQLGYLYPGVLHDGLIAFWNPAANAKQLRLFITNVKTDFDANDWSRTSLEFSFEFAVTSK
jgi:hypothetical protein